MKVKIFLFGILWAWKVQAQNIKGRIMYLNAPVSKAIVQIKGSKQQAVTDSTGYFEMRFSGTYCQLSVHYPGFLPSTQKLVLSKDTFLTIELKPDTSYLYEVQIEDTKLLATKKPDPFNTEVYDACILHSASAVSLFEGVQNINGLRPQLNCNICNTGDIHINGMEGPYTNVLIDGMPVIGGIASVYGLTGIASDIIERMEINRYPGSVIYGSDNIGGTINIITKTPTRSKFKADVQFYTSSYFDNNLDISFQKKIKNYGFINSFNLVYFDKLTDSNRDNFTDVTLQKRFSGFHKSRWTFKDSSVVQCIFRGLIEDRWGGQLNWNKHFRGSDSIYGESIITKRLESITHYSLYLGKHKIENAVSYNYHYQDSYYGTLFFEAAQHNLYYQTYTHWYSKKSQYTLGLAFKYLYYKDNTEVFKNTTPYSEWLVPGLFSENTFTLSEKLKLLLSFRYDYHNIHKHIWTPRIAGIFSNPSKTFTWRSGVTTGFRPVQLFTEDHAALTGARKVILQEKLKPEKSMAIYSALQTNVLNNNFVQLTIDFNAWYIYFSNRIIPDYTHPDKILYYNLAKNEYSVNRGLSIQMQSLIRNYFQMLVGFSLLDNYFIQNGLKRRMLLSEPWSATVLMRTLLGKFKIEYTASIYGKMYLPKAGALDPRPNQSPVYSIQNIQCSYSLKNIELSIGIKNLLNFTPDKGLPFLIARAHDPFDKKVNRDAEGNPLSTDENPYALTFDPTYTYASMQKRRLFIHLAFHF